MWIQYIKGMARKLWKKKQCTNLENESKRLSETTGLQVTNKDICDACDECLEVIDRALKNVKEWEDSKK